MSKLNLKSAYISHLLQLVQSKYQFDGAEMILLIGLSQPQNQSYLKKIMKEKYTKIKKEEKIPRIYKVTSSSFLVDIGQNFLNSHQCQLETLLNVLYLFGRMQKLKIVLSVKSTQIEMKFVQQIIKLFTSFAKIFSEQIFPSQFKNQKNQMMNSICLLINDPESTHSDLITNLAKQQNLFEGNHGEFMQSLFKIIVNNKRIIYEETSDMREKTLKILRKTNTFSFSKKTRQALFQPFLKEIKDRKEEWQLLKEFIKNMYDSGMNLINLIQEKICELSTANQKKKIIQELQKSIPWKIGITIPERFQLNSDKINENDAIIVMETLQRIFFLDKVKEKGKLFIKFIWECCESKLLLKQQKQEKSKIFGYITLLEAIHQTFCFPSISEKLQEKTKKMLHQLFTTLLDMFAIILDGTQLTCSANLIKSIKKFRNFLNLEILEESHPTIKNARLIFLKSFMKIQFMYFESRIKKNTFKSSECLIEGLELENSLRQISQEYSHNEYFEFNKMLKKIYITVGIQLKKLKQYRLSLEMFHAARSVEHYQEVIEVCKKNHRDQINLKQAIVFYSELLLYEDARKLCYSFVNSSQNRRQCQEIIRLLQMIKEIQLSEEKQQNMAEKMIFSRLSFLEEITIKQIEKKCIFPEGTNFI